MQGLGTLHNLFKIHPKKEINPTLRVYYFNIKRSLPLQAKESVWQG